MAKRVTFGAIVGNRGFFQDESCGVDRGIAGDLYKRMIDLYSAEGVHETISVTSGFSNPVTLAADRSKYIEAIAEEVGLRLPTSTCFVSPVGGEHIGKTFFLGRISAWYEPSYDGLRRPGDPYYWGVTGEQPCRHYQSDWEEDDACFRDVQNIRPGRIDDVRFYLNLWSRDEEHCRFQHCGRWGTSARVCPWLSECITHSFEGVNSHEQDHLRLCRRSLGIQRPFPEPWAQDIGLSRPYLQYDCW